MRDRVQRFLMGVLEAAVPAACCLAVTLAAESAAAPTEPGAGWVSRYFDQARLVLPEADYFVATGPCGRLDLARWLFGSGAGPEMPPARTVWLVDMLGKELAPEEAVLTDGTPVWAAAAMVGSGLLVVGNALRLQGGAPAANSPLATGARPSHAEPAAASAAS